MLQIGDENDWTFIACPLCRIKSYFINLSNDINQIPASADFHLNDALITNYYVLEAIHWFERNPNADPVQIEIVLQHLNLAP